MDKKKYLKISLFFICYLGLIALMLFKMAGYSLVGIKGNSMYPTIRNGDLGIMKEVNPYTDLKVGMIVGIDSDNKNIIHRVSRILQYFILTKGDNCRDEDMIATILNVKNRCVLRVPYLGFLYTITISKASIAVYLFLIVLILIGIRIAISGFKLKGII
ncbi:MAG: signal peptidase I [Parcubacteria group bacterium]